MPSGKRENFTIRLVTDRHQRKALDGFLEKAQRIVSLAFDEQKAGLLVGVPLRLEELAERVGCETDLHRETVLHACVMAQDKVSAVLGGEIDGRRRGKGYSLFEIPGSSVIFSVFERKVGIPHLGACSFKRNMFILSQVEGTEAKQLAMTPYKVELGYLYNEPVVIVDTVDRTPKRQEFTDQKLVKVVRKPKA